LKSLTAATRTAKPGTDAFAVLQSRVEHADPALGLAYRLLEGISRDMEIGSHRLQVGASIGLLMYPPCG